MKIEKATIVRTIVFAVAVINRFLTSKGYGFNLVIDDATADVLANLFLSVMGLVVLWYNNSFTDNALQADDVLKQLRRIDKAFDENNETERGDKE